MKQQAQFTARRYGNPGMSVRIVAVVGTNGKATTARYVNEMLQEAGLSTSLLISDEGSLGVKRTQLFLRDAKKANVRYAIIALSFDDIRQHSLALSPIETVIVTNISSSMQESAEDQLEALRQLLEAGPKYIVLNRDDEHFDALADLESAHNLTYGQHEEAEARIDQIKLFKKGSEVKLVVDHQTKLRLATYLVGTANVYNLTAAVAAVYVMGENILSMDEGAARLEAVPGNFEYLPAGGHYKIILDMAPNDAALRSVVASAKELTARRLIVVIQANITSEELIEELADQVDRLIVVDVNDFQPTRGTVERVVSTDAAIKLGLRAARQDDTVLLAGPVFARNEPGGHSYALITIENTFQD